MEPAQSNTQMKPWQDEITFEIPSHKICSSYLQAYKDLMGETSAKEDIQQVLFNHKILYTPSSPFQSFSFGVEMIVPVPDFYKINVKIAHFTLSLTAIRHYSNSTFKKPFKSRGFFGKISFVEFNNKQICFKGFPFKNEQQFHPLLRKVVKQLSILKICSALKCGPYMENYFGFDFIIYDDSIQYATEQGQKIKQFNKHSQQHLQQQLSILHKLKIIHYDIKPQNIIFSKIFQKPVLIDFGLSQIIEEEMGFKTLSFFRGTPSYCTQEMLFLLTEQYRHIDLYYNDAFCLFVSFDQIQRQNCDQSGNQDNQPMQYVINRQQSFYLFAFKYHYLLDKEFECKFYLQKYLSVQGNVRSVLEFIKYVFRYIFLDQIFDQYLKKYKNNNIYQQIVDERKIYLEKIFIRRRQEVEEVIHNEISLIPLPHLSNNQNKEGIQTRKDYESLFQLIMKLKILQEKTIWSYLSLVFACVRFDTRNLAVKQKHQIAMKINPLLSTFRGLETQATQQRPELDEIKMLLSSILEFCLEVKPNAWAKGNLIDIFEQLAILDVDLSVLIDPFLNFFEFDSSKPLQSILYVLQCNRLKNTMLLIISTHMEKIEAIQKRLSIFIERNLRKFKEQNFESTDKEIISIHKIMQIIKITNDKQCSKLIFKNEDLLIYINHPKIRKQLLYLITQKDISFQHFQTQSEYVLQKALYLKRCWHSNKLNFFCWVQVTMRIMKIISSNYQLQNFLKEVENTINCQEIMKNIMQNSWLLLESNQTIFNEKLNKLLLSYRNFGSLTKQGELIFHEIIQEVVNGSQIIDQRLYLQLKQLYHYYQQYHMKINSKQKTEHFQFLYRFSQTYWNAEIQAFFYAFSPDTQRILKLRFDQAEQQIKTLKDEQQLHKYELQFRFFKLYLYQFTYFKLENKIQQCVDSLVLFTSHCDKLNLQMLTLEGLKKINQLACIKKIVPLIISSTNQLFNYCIMIKYFSFYLLPQHCTFIITTIIVFAQNDQNKLYGFIEKMINFLRDHPIDSYFATLLAALDSFLERDPKHGYLIHFCKLEQRIQCLLKNPYFLIFYMYSLGDQSENTNKMKVLKTIATYIDKLSRFAKKKILEKYFTVIIRFLRNQKIQQRLFNFRYAKIYLKKRRIIFETKILLHRLDKPRCVKIANFMKQKIRAIINNVNSCDKIV